MKESLSAIPKQPVFRETFTDEQTTRLNGGVPTAVTYFNGVASFNGTSSSLNISKPVKGVYSVRYKFTSFTPTNGRNILDCRFNSGTGEVYQGSASSFLATTGTIYVDGIATNTVSSRTREIIISGITLSTSNPVFFSNYINSGANIECSAELIEIYDYTLTANEVKNLYEGKRNRIIDLQQTAPSSANYLYTGVGNDTTGTYCQTSTNVSPQVNTNFAFEFNFKDFTSRGILAGCPTASSEGWSLQIQGGTNVLRFYGRNSSINVVTVDSTAAITVTGNRWVKVVRSGNDYSFFEKADGGTYTQVGTTITNSTALDSYTLPIQIGNGFGTNYISIGIKILRARFYNDATATNLVVDFNPQLYVSGTTLPSSTGEVYTINGTQGFIGNGSRPEILNIDGRNGVIANKYNPENLFTRTDTFGSDFIFDRATKISNITSPFGLAINIVPNTPSTYHRWYFLSAGTVGVNVFSIKAKQNGYKYLHLRSDTGTSIATFDLNLGIIYSQSNCLSATITPLQDGYFKVAISYVRSSVGWVAVYVYDNSAQETYTPDGISGILLVNPLLNSEKEKPYVENTGNSPLSSTLINTAVTPVRQGSVWGMDFNGSTSKLDCGNYDSLLGDVTFIAWYKAATLGSGSAGRIIDNGQMQIHSGGYFTRNSSTFINFISAWKLGIWTQVVITSTSTGLTNTYINGVLVGSANQNAGSPVAGSNNILLGNNNSSNRCFNGKGNQIRIIKGILNAQEVQQLFDNERHDYGI